MGDKNYANDLDSQVEAPRSHDRYGIVESEAATSRNVRHHDTTTMNNDKAADAVAQEHVSLQEQK
jgi:hypothetical protein